MMGAGAGGPRAIQYTVAHPEQVSALVLYGTFSAIPDAFPPGVLNGFAQLARANWELASHAFVAAGIRRKDEQEALRWAEMLRRSISGETIATILETHADQDLTPFLPQIQCPTLVCHSVDDSYVPFELGQRMAESIPDARLVRLEGEDGGVFTDPQPAMDSIDAFLPRLPYPPVADSRPKVATTAQLTPREIEVLRLLAAGLTSKAISRDLSLSIRTVGRHITNIYEKIGATSRSEATAYAIRHRLTEE
jgi:DNA-binding CsgD family transcriptional regulator